MNQNRIFKQHDKDACFCPPVSLQDIQISDPVFATVSTHFIDIIFTIYAQKCNTGPYMMLDLLSYMVVQVH